MSNEPLIVVGVDGSEPSRAAVRWAAAEAQSRHAAVRLVHAWDVYPDTRSARLLLADDGRPREAAVLAEASEQLRDLAPAVEQDSELSEGRPDKALLRAAEHAELLVVGRHDGSAARLGPTLSRLVVRAGCPVVAVPAGSSPAPRSVVVGVDGSLLSDDAVDVAYEHAARCGLPLIAVLAVPASFGVFLPGETELDEVRGEGARHLSEALAGRADRYPEVRVSEVVVLGGPLLALQEAARTAALLVVGSHGRGALLRAALGSVSSSLLRSAACPVAVVRPRALRPELLPAVSAASTAPLTYL